VLLLTRKRWEAEWEVVGDVAKPKLKLVEPLSITGGVCGMIMVT
jgi:hypothetical protein